MPLWRLEKNQFSFLFLGPPAFLAHGNSRSPLAPASIVTVCFLLTDSLVSFCKDLCDGIGLLGTIKDNQPLHLKYLNVFFFNCICKIPLLCTAEILGIQDVGIFEGCYSAFQNYLLFLDGLTSISLTAPFFQLSTKLRVVDGEVISPHLFPLSSRWWFSGLFVGYS